jgi:uncharacterized protein (TIGR03437 family)
MGCGLLLYVGAFASVVLAQPPGAGGRTAVDGGGDLQPPRPVITGAFNAASNLSGGVAPGELVLLAGLGFGPAQLVSAAPDSNGLYPTQLAGTTVLVNRVPAPLIYTSATLVAAVVPDSLLADTTEIAVAYHGRTSSVRVPIVPSAPGIFTVDSTGRGHMATINQSGLINAPVNWGDTITLFVTGIGQATSGSIYFWPGSPLQIAIPISGGDVQGTAAGVTQIKVPNPYGLDCDTPVTFQVGSASSQAGVTIANGYMYMNSPSRLPVRFNRSRPSNTPSLPSWAAGSFRVRFRSELPGRPSNEVTIGVH